MLCLLVLAVSANAQVFTTPCLFDNFGSLQFLDGNPVARDMDVSHNTAILDQAYDRYGSDWIGYPEYQMWDLGE